MTKIQRNLSTRFIWLVSALVTIAILTTTLTFVWYEMTQGRNLMEQQNTELAQLIAWNSSAALAFEDVEGAGSLLRSVGIQRGIIAAYLQQLDGQVFSAYSANHRLSELPKNALSEVVNQRQSVSLYLHGRLHTVAPIRVDGEIQGVVHLVNDQSQLHLLQDDFFRIVVLLLLFSIPVSWLLIRRVQHHFSVPIQELADTIAEVTHSQDYSVRVETYSHDELGRLGGAFNIMLEQLQKREQLIAQHQAELTSAVEQRTSALSETNQALSDANKALQLSNQQLEVAKDTAEVADHAKMAFLANMSHEIRTPMNAVYGLADLLALTQLDEIQKGYLSDLQISAQTLLELIDDVLDIAKIESGSLQLNRSSFALRDMLKRLETVLGHQARGKNLAFTIDCDAAIPNVLLGDSVRLMQILMNLVGNAIKFTAEGQVELTLKQVWEQTGQTRIKIAVQDTGIGIEKSNIARLFDAFKQADGSITRRFGGTGLGLTISQHLVERMGGHISVESEIGTGSSFQFELTFTKASESEISGLECDPESINEPHWIERCLKGIHLLLVEDVLMNQQVIKALLETRGARVSVADNGEQAVAWLRENHCDLVLMDLRMPVMDGYTATEHIRRRSGDDYLPIVALTAEATTDEKQRCLNIGMDGYLTKPVEVNRMISAIRALLPKASKKHLLVCDESTPCMGTVTASTPIPDYLAEFTWMNAELALKAHGGNLSLFSRVLNAGREHLPALYDNLRDWAEDDSQPGPERCQQLGELAHKLIGPLGAIGAFDLLTRVRALEQRCLRPSDHESASLIWFDEVKRLAASLAEVVVGLNQIPHEMAVSQANRSDSVMSTTELEENLQGLREHIISHRFEALEVIERLIREPLLETDHAEITRRLHAQIKRFKFDQGLETLDQLMAATVKEN